MTSPTNPATTAPDDATRRRRARRPTPAPTSSPPPCATIPPWSPLQSSTATNGIPSNLPGSRSSTAAPPRCRNAALLSSRRHDLWIERNHSQPLQTSGGRRAAQTTRGSPNLTTKRAGLADNPGTAPHNAPRPRQPNSHAAPDAIGGLASTKTRGRPTAPQNGATPTPQPAADAVPHVTAQTSTLTSDSLGSASAAAPRDITDAAEGGGGKRPRRSNWPSHPTQTSNRRQLGDFDARPESPFPERTRGTGTPDPRPMSSKLGRCEAQRQKMALFVRRDRRLETAHLLRGVIGRNVLTAPTSPPTKPQIIDHPTVRPRIHKLTAPTFLRRKPTMPRD